MTNKGTKVDTITTVEDAKELLAKLRKEERLQQLKDGQYNADMVADYFNQHIKEKDKKGKVKTWNEQKVRRLVREGKLKAENTKSVAKNKKLGYLFSQADLDEFIKFKKMSDDDKIDLIKKLERQVKRLEQDNKLLELQISNNEQESENKSTTKTTKK